MPRLLLVKTHETDGAGFTQDLVVFRQGGHTEAQLPDRLRVSRSIKEGADDDLYAMEYWAHDVLCLNADDLVDAVDEAAGAGHAAAAALITAVSAFMTGDDSVARVDDPDGRLQAALTDEFLDRPGPTRLTAPTVSVSDDSVWYTVVPKYGTDEELTSDPVSAADVIWLVGEDPDPDPA